MITKIPAQSYTASSKTFLIDQRSDHHRPLRNPARRSTRVTVQPRTTPTITPSQPQPLLEKKVTTNPSYVPSQLGLAALAGLTTLNALIIGAWISPSSMTYLGSASYAMLSSFYSSLEQISHSALDMLGIRS